MPSSHVSTIFAPASGFGRAAVSVIRISGPSCTSLLKAIGGTVPEPRRLSLRALRDPETREVLDRGLVVFMPAPATFTGEDMAELHLHGGVAVRHAVLGVLGRFPGCQAAGPGDFSRRAAFNGRLDLTQAEGIADLVDAETEAQRRQALRQLDGALGRQVEAWRSTAIDLYARTEAALDFADEGDVDEEGLEAGLAQDARALADSIRAALGDGRRGERLREGFFVVLAGPPNAGKSTLLNALAGREAAIVSAIPGTTRDAIEVRCDLGGLPVVLVDTAGLRETDDPVESEGIRRTRRRMEDADLVLHLSPAGEGVASEPVSARGLAVRTKIDLTDSRSGGDSAGIGVCALSGAGLDALLEAIRAAAERSLGGSDALITRERHRTALTEACAHLDRVAGGAVAAPELVAEDLRLAVRALGTVVGHVGVEEMLDRLFAGFCIGK
ncbi:tRNA uridine-5-carboxymethylaminomethyl(34) synthesis GTPase MnmE [Methylobacterium gnaphalii]|nr:tRNA uridine-5-carboxymethylaminomethyl(34) synthesis GTPase MnmE [Methylobacterium gnaphalii]GJD67937.1 tRNA modification GTPase MnmE [Methylobacterium gnaphalii]